MNWKTVMGEILTYDGTTDCIDLLQTQDLYIQDGHLREMLSLNDCIDYGPIEIGDTILLLIGKIYILKNMNMKKD